MTIPAIFGSHNPHSQDPGWIMAWLPPLLAHLGSNGGVEPFDTAASGIVYIYGNYNDLGAILAVIYTDNQKATGEGLMIK